MTSVVSEPGDGADMGHCALVTLSLLTRFSLEPVDVGDRAITQLEI